ncbi:MAG TPA: FHA domain-containing protein [Myxococcota bacterium]|nr:FHA domain-containing protein [Myxococcota bacterium]HRY94306.1 FHA domain-containing protein [Myxococcota bacterium]HSA23797.1 FHA domain-containing protein [Myxococcota bacterium]
MSTTGAGGGGKRFALRFISGKYQGGEFPLQPNREIVVGRSSDLDMVLVEDMVSRKHAKISTSEGLITIQDLGSTNGTFVNGEKIKKARLQEGDRILIGTSILKLVAMAQGGSDKPLDDAEIKSMMEQVAARKKPSASPMSGRIDEVPLPDLLQLLSTSKKSGVMVIRTEEHVGKIYLRNGRIYFASIDDDHEMDPQKAFTRLLAWSTGVFDLSPPSNEKFVLELDESTEGMLMDAMRQLDELKRIEDQRPATTARFGVARPLNPALRDLNPEQLDILQLVHNHGQVQLVLDKSMLSDLETYQALAHLVRKGYIREMR